MSELAIPSVQLTTIDKSHYSPRFTSEVAAYVGYFEKGPINKPIFITSPEELKFTFGRGIDMYRNDWYQVYNYLQYSSGIWVVRTSGRVNLNASIGTPLFFNTRDDFDLAYDSLPIQINGFSGWAKTPGGMGNLLDVSLITNIEWEANYDIGHGYNAKDVFEIFEEFYVGLVVFRKGKVVEKFYITELELEYFRETRYLYTKFDYSNPDNIVAFYNDASPNIYGNFQPMQSLTGGITTFSLYDNLSESHDLLLNTDEYDIDILIGNEYANELAVNVAETRRDCIAFVGLPSKFITFLKSQDDPVADVLYTQDGKAITLASASWSKDDHLTTNLLSDYIMTIPKSQFVHFIGNIKEQNDGFTNKKVLINLAGDLAGLKAQASLERPWHPGAGIERGVIKNMESVYFDFSKADKHWMFRNNVNFIENGFVATQKTFVETLSSFDRVNVRSLFNHVEKTAAKLLRKYVFDENHRGILNSIKFEIQELLIDVKSNRGISDSYVEVNTSQSNPNEIIVNVYIKPTYVAEFIHLRLTNSGTNAFSSVLNTTIG